MRQLSIGQRVQLRESEEKYGGLFGHIIHRDWVTGNVVYRREHPEARPGQGRLALVVQLEDPLPGMEPVILCYEEQVSAQ